MGNKKKSKRDFDEVGRGRAGKKRGVRNKVKRDTRERRKEEKKENDGWFKKGARLEASQHSARGKALGY